MAKNVRIYGTRVVGKHGVYPANTIVRLDDEEASLIVASALAEPTEAACQCDHDYVGQEEAPVAVEEEGNVDDNSDEGEAKVEQDGGGENEE